MSGLAGSAGADGRRHRMEAPSGVRVPMGNADIPTVRLEVAFNPKRASAGTSLIDAAMTPIVSSRRRHRTAIIRVGVALRCAARSRRQALAHRIVGAILKSAASPGDGVCAKRKSRVICLGLGLPCRRNHTHRQNRQSQNAHAGSSSEIGTTPAHLDRQKVSIQINSRSRAQMRGW